MNNIYKILFIKIILSTTLFANGGKVLVEIFTNSGCAACVPAHAALDSYLSGDNGDMIEFVYYHIEWPAPQDKLYTFNVSDSKLKNNYYGPFYASPQAFFNGKHVLNSFSQWPNELDNLLNEDKMFQIEIHGVNKNTSFELISTISNLTNISDSTLTINYVVVEDVNYKGVNGISDHKNVMRKIKNVSGTQFVISANETLQLSTILAYNYAWNEDNLKAIVFIQDKLTKEVYEVNSIKFTDFTITDIDENQPISNTFNLEQNYPNPFNPTTKIKYSIPFLPTKNNSNVQLYIYNNLGETISTLVDKPLNSGSYEITFNSENLTSGIYFYRLSYSGFSKTNKMILIK